MRVLIVEDNALLGAGLRSALGRSGFQPTWVKDGEAALKILASESFLAMVIDVGLPGISGLDVLQVLRDGGSKMPVLVLTARDTTLDKVISLDSGADDFLAKTTDIEELAARLRALVRRSGSTEKYVAGDLALDLEARTLSLKGEVINLSKREFDLMRLLMVNTGRVVTRNQLELTLFGNERAVESNSLEVHIHNLRGKIGTKTLRTIRGVGYTISP
jgi:two-component system OmpR family response regulator/two-component system response regulator QseB